VTPVGSSSTSLTASGEKLSPSPLGPERATVSTASEWVPVAAKQDNCCGAVVPIDIVGQNIKDVCEYGSARSPGGRAIVEKLPIQFSTSREYTPVAVGEKLDLVWDAVPLWALLGRKIQDVCGQVFARSRDRSPPAIVEKLPILFGSEGSTVTVSAARESPPVGEKLDFIERRSPIRFR